MDNTSNAVESERLNTKVISQEPFTDIVCYGIGKLTSCPIARYQFAFLLLLKEFLQVMHTLGRADVTKYEFSLGQWCLHIFML